MLIHALQPWRPAPGVRDRRWPFAAMAGLAIVAILPLAADVPFLFRDRVCQSGELECRWILVQADQVANDPAAGRQSSTTRSIEPRATVWGRSSSPPAGRGEWRRDRGRHPCAFRQAPDRRLRHRAVRHARRRRLGYVDCPGSSGRYRSSLWFDVRPAVIDDFVDACIEETGVDPARLGDYGSAQLAEDIETIRRDLGVERIALYAESPGRSQRSGTPSRIRSG